MTAAFRLSVRVRNNLLITRREELGMSQAAFARAVGVHLKEYNPLETMRRTPLTRDGDWRAIALRVAEFHGVSPDDLWPECVLRIKDPSLTREIGERELLRLTGRSPERILLEAEASAARVKVIEETLGQVLSPREERILLAVHRDGETQESVGKREGLNRERVRQIAMRAGWRVRRAVVDRETRQLLVSSEDDL